MLQSKAGYIDARPLTAKLSKLLATHGRTIHLGQSRRFDRVQLTSGLTPQADMIADHGHVSKGPEGDVVILIGTGI